MTQKINTGNQRVCRNKTGIANSMEVLKTGSKDETTKYWNELNKDAEYNYYREEEIIYRGSLKDNNNKNIDSAPGWIRMQTF